MFTRTLGQMTADVRVRANYLNAQYPTDAQIKEWLNQDYVFYYDKLIASGEKYFLVQPAPVSTTSNNVQTYALPSDFYELLGVDVQFNSNQWYPAHRFQFEQRNDYSFYATAGWQWPSDVKYDLWGNTLAFIPIPNGAYTYKLWYYPRPVRLATDGSADGQSWDGPDSGLQYVIDRTARRIASQDGDPEMVAMLSADIAEAEANIRTMASRRNAGEAPKARVVRGRVFTPGNRRRWWAW
jgi:hypothetical protein